MLKEKGMALAVVSNSDGRVRELLDAAGVLPYLDEVFDSHEIGFEKPDPRLFHHALERLQLKADRALYVGDLESIDVVGAQRAGLTPALVDPDSAVTGKDFLVVSSVSELPPAIEASI